MSGINVDGIVLKFVAGISLILFSIFTCETGHSIGLQILPSDLNFQTDKSRTTKILTALLLENNRFYRESNQVWSSLPQENDRVQSHLYYNKLAIDRFALSEESPINQKSKLLKSRYLSWQRQWSHALKALEGIRDKEVSNEVQMERIRLNLLLGHYIEAGKIVKGLNPVNHREQMQLEVFSIWLNILKGNRKPAQAGIDKLEENYLYLPLSTMFPIDFLDPDEKLEVTLKSMLMRFPSNSELFEQLILFCKKHKRWKVLDDLVRSQKFINGFRVDWGLRAEMYLHTGQVRRLEKLVKSKNALTAGPILYDVLARLAIKRKNWELLFQVSKSLRSHYPQLLDGLLYQVIYFQETGRENQAQALLKQAGL